MKIIGHWWQGNDGVTRPIVTVNVAGADRKLHSERFLIDSGADCTALSAAFQERLQLPTRAPETMPALLGIGGRREYLFVSVGLEFLNDAGRIVRVHGEIVAFVEASATDMSILGRDVLDSFDVILSRRREEVLLLAPNHQYVVTD